MAVGLILLLLLGEAALTCGQTDDLFAPLEEALTSNPENLVILREICYPSTWRPELATLVEVGVTVGTIQWNSTNSDKPAFVLNPNTSLYESAPLLQVEISHRLQEFISASKSIIPLLQLNEYVTFQLLNILTRSTSITNHHYFSLNLSIPELPTMPSSDSLNRDLIYLLSWAKYYAKYGNVTTYERRDSDRVSWKLAGIAYYYESVDKVKIATLTLFYTLQTAIAIAGIYSIPKLLKWGAKKLKVPKEQLYELSIATVLVFFLINTCCAIIYWVSKSLHGGFWKCWIPYAMVIVPLEVIFIGVISIWREESHLKRMAYTFAVCHVLWFLHRVGGSVVVACYFLTVAPVQTLAGFTLIYAVVILTILSIALLIHLIKKLKKEGCCRHTKDSWALGISITGLLIFYIAVFGSLVSVTVIFNMVDRIGRSSGFSDVIASLVPPVLVSLITVWLKDKYNSYFKQKEPAGEGTAAEQGGGPDQGPDRAVNRDNSEVSIVAGASPTAAVAESTVNSNSSGSSTTAGASPMAALAKESRESDLLLAEHKKATTEHTIL